MDNLSHSLVGLMLARAGMNRGEKNTTAMLVVAANIPDVDAYAFLTSPATYLDVHRGYTHALVFAPLMALLAVAVVKVMELVAATYRAKGYTWAAFLAMLNLTNVAAKKGIKPKVEYREFNAGSYFYLWLCCIGAVLSHLLMDWTNV
ncbi:MAG: metal-dependent hydrolase, partial [Acidobacteriota bacterium]